jgi:hypothetical protein
MRTRQHSGGLRFATALIALATATQNALPASPAFVPPTARDRVLVIAPHPDDESLCCGGLIRRTLKNGGSVAIVWITSGDAFELDEMVVEHTLHPRAGLEKLAVLRMAEARQAATTLGVAADNQYFLGYPDRGIRRLLLDHYDVAYRCLSEPPTPGAILNVTCRVCWRASNPRWWWRPVPMTCMRIIAPPVSWW